MDINKDIERRSHAYLLETRIDWDQPEKIKGDMKSQIFKSDYSNMHISVKVHKHNICMAIIYGMENNQLLDTMNGTPSYFFSGFKEKYGRMPKAQDKIVLLAGKQYFSNINVDTVYSLLNWELK